MSDFFQKEIRSSSVIASLMTGETEKYAPLSLEKVKLGEPVPFDLYLKMKDKESAVPQMVRCCAPGDIFQKEWFDKLKQLQLQWVYFSVTEVDRVFVYLQRQMEDLFQAGDLDQEEKARQVYDLTQVWIMRFFVAEQSRTGEQINLALSLVDNLLESIKHSSQNSLLLMEIQQQSHYVYTHSVNCCLLGIAFANYLGWPADKARNFGLGALIHDIGYSRLPRELLDKEPATKADKARIQRHPLEGFRMLQGFAHLPWEALQMVLRHHENGDGSGYPEGLNLIAIPSWARIMRIVDSYEVMTSDRPWRPARPPKEVLWTMLHDCQNSKIYDPAYLKAFIKFLAGLSRN